MQIVNNVYKVYYEEDKEHKLRIYVGEIVSVR